MRYGRTDDLYNWSLAFVGSLAFVVVEYLEGVIFIHRLHPLQIRFSSVLFCTEEGHNAKMWRFLVFLAVVLY